MAWGRKDRDAKEGGSDGARSSIIAAFWKLLDDKCRFGELNAGALASGARCSKASFYYNFSSVEEVAVAALDREFESDTAMAQDVFKLFSGAGTGAVDDVLHTQRWDRVTLLVRQGGGEVVRTVLLAQTDDLWRQVLCPDDGELDPEARSVAEFLAMGGLTVILDHLRAADRGVDTPLPGAFFSDTMQRAFEEMCRAQGVSQQEVIDGFWGAGASQTAPATSGSAFLSPASGRESVPAAPADPAAGAEGAGEASDKLGADE